MSFADIEIKKSYKTNSSNIVQDFYLPVLSEAVLYKRAVGFFTSGALIELSKGISGLIKKDGKMRFIVSPKLTEEDIEAIQKGYDDREIVTKALDREFIEPQDSSDKERLGWLSYLISNCFLEIKVAFTLDYGSGMYHEKKGIVYDSDGNRIAFIGSMNETANAFYNNYESIAVFNSLDHNDIERIQDFDNDFDSLWESHEKKIKVIEFPKVIKDRLQAYKAPDSEYMADRLAALDEEEIQRYNSCASVPKGIPCIPPDVKLHDYQIDAINSWAVRGYRGIFDMATGTGKTYTGLGAVTALYQHTERLAIIIVAPYQHLVDQWVEDIEKFNMRPIIGHSASVQKDWKRRLADDIIDFNIGVIPTFCFVTTNATFSSDFVQNQIHSLGKDTLLVVDEAHNFGAYNLSRKLNENIQYRLALSATLERHGDEEGTQALYDYFGEKCIEYDLQRAIKEDKLTPYYYYPCVVHLTEEELKRYRELSAKLKKQCHVDSSGKVTMSEQGKKIAIERARLIAGAENKVYLLKKIISEKYLKDTHMLIYCGAARNYNPSLDSSETDEEGERQIVSVSKMLGNELGMKVTHFTSAESAQERSRIKTQFANADPYQAIVAIKCLDEGVNIPSIKTAFILASSTNPKEYIQRRGRVLRKYKGKKFAVIYDFVTLPTAIDDVQYGSDGSNFDLSLVKREMVRMKEFGEISMNPADTDKLISELSDAYGMDIIDLDEGVYDYE